MTNSELLLLLRQTLKKQGYDGLLLPMTDEYQNEYCAEYARRITYLTGFDGSAGMTIILPKHATLLTDGRYTLQATQEVDTSLYAVHNSADVSAASYLKAHCNSDESYIVTFDPWLHTQRAIDTLRATLPDHITLTPCDSNPVDNIWHDQPSRPSAPITLQPDQLAGRSSQEKIHQLCDSLNEDALLITQPDAICWLLNIRGNDVPYNPLPLCYAIMERNGTVHLMIDPAKVQDVALPSHISLVNDAHILEFFSALSYDSLRIDPATCPYWFVAQCNESHINIVYGTNPITLAKAIKNKTEIEGIIRAHAIDGIAVSDFLTWCDTLNNDDTVTELDIVAKLESYRARHDDYRGASFATIAGAGEHGAIIHYRAQPQTNRAWNNGDVLLVDSGGQYPYGTTDITRTIVRGTPSDSFKRHFTLVLKGHIALARATFPEGTTGHQLDILARQFLWEDGLDYQHGTGHGVGHYLCVHEGPQSISARASNVALQPGMILSNEPGYYAEGKYGIRIESLVLVVERERGVLGTRYFGFDTISLAPIDTTLTDPSLMTSDEQQWLDNYNQQCADNNRSQPA